MTASLVSEGQSDEFNWFSPSISSSRPSIIELRNEETKNSDFTKSK